MKLRILIFALSILPLATQAQTDTSFLLKDKTLVKVTPINGFERIEIRTSKNDKVQVLDSIEQSITGRSMDLTVEDYNFDGFSDFSCSHVDDGMGVYRIYQIFIYNPKTNLFDKLEIPSGCYPECELFCDITVNKKKKQLISSCRGGASWHKDIWKFGPDGKLKLLTN